MDLGLKNKSALITGGTSGIGLAIAKRLGQEGCKVIVCGRDQSRLDKAIEDLKSMGLQAYGFLADICKPDQVASLVKSTISTVGGGLLSSLGKPVKFQAPM